MFFCASKGVSRTVSAANPRAERILSYGICNRLSQDFFHMGFTGCPRRAL
ncbi:hypothetical protein PDR5_07600 [Pseudomonas sp. DR 5-09]|nr:hypothetical protein PDR5_07600 [Pseudomonas sp. DR 5-09]